MWALHANKKVERHSKDISPSFFMDWLPYFESSMFSVHIVIFDINWEKYLQKNTFYFLLVSLTMVELILLG